AARTVMILRSTPGALRMRIVITGGAGFLGRKLATVLLARGNLTDARGKQRAIEHITLVDVARAPAEPDSRVHAIAGDLGDPALWPQSSYGNQKAVGEFLVYDFTRKGFVNGRSLRLPTVSVRPGKPNKAASSFASGILREPLNGVEAICPVSRGTRMWLLSP